MLVMIKDGLMQSKGVQGRCGSPSMVSIEPTVRRRLARVYLFYYFDILHGHVYVA